jgi:hypothetical protein
MNVVGRAELGGRTEVDSGGTTPSFAVRSGIELTDRWGVEVELSHDLKLEQSEVGERGTFGPSLILSTVIVRPGEPREIVNPVFRIDSTQRVTAVNTLAWVSTPIGARVDFVVAAGVSFARREFEESYHVEPASSPGFLRSSVAFSPDAVRILSYDVGPIVGTEARISVGTRFRVMPGLRLSGTAGMWSVRPTAGAAWTF